MPDANVQSNGEGKKASKKWPSLSRLIRRKGKMIVSPSPQSPPKEPETWSIYLSCKDLPLHIFRRCIAENNWAHLVKEGNPPQSVIDDTGLSIYSEFCERSGGPQLSILIERTRTIHILSSRIDRVAMLIEIAGHIADDDLIAAFAQEGFKLEAARMQSGTDEQYRESLAKIESKMKADILKLERLRKEAPKARGDEKFNDADFDQTLSAIEDHKKTALDWDNITVLRYCIYVQRLRDHIENLNKQARKPWQTN